MSNEIQLNRVAIKIAGQAALWTANAGQPAFFQLDGRARALLKGMHAKTRPAKRTKGQKRHGFPVPSFFPDYAEFTNSSQ
ncbi:MAG: hypothetical protein HZA02_06755 [Nitrospinae bacterium]|nr:hypothetical protein [Nitrospinota bacterium]